MQNDVVYHMKLRSINVNIITARYRINIWKVFSLTDELTNELHSSYYHIRILYDMILSSTLLSLDVKQLGIHLLHRTVCGRVVHLLQVYINQLVVCTEINILNEFFFN